MKILKFFVYMTAFLFFVGFLISLGAMMVTMRPPSEKISEASILRLDLEGIILDGKDFLEQLRKYSDKDEIKGILIHINSPGGVVGPSQEIYREIKRVREELNKPVVVTCSAVAASGAYYAAVAADKIFTNAGTMLGSIGVIMEFANLEALYDWAKIKRYVIKTGAFKDAGAEYRNMSEAERELFQNMIDEVYDQFKQAVMHGRGLSRDVVEKYADGRVFVGETAVRLGFADQVGTYEDARRMVGELAGLGQDPKVFAPKKPQEKFIELLLESVSKISSGLKPVESLPQLKLLGKPLYLMPGSFLGAY